MKQQNIYVLERWPRDHEARTEFEAVDERVGDAPRCPACGEFIGPVAWLPPYRVRLVLVGKSFGDLVFGAGYDVLLTERVRRLVESCGLTIPSRLDRVEIVGVRGDPTSDGPIPRYWHANVPISSSVVVDDGRSGLERDGPVTCDVCRLDGVERLKRLVLEEGSEPEEDLFVARGLPGIFLASSRLKEAFEAHGVSNAHFFPADEFSFDVAARP